MARGDDDPIAELERLEAFLDGSERREVPIEVLRARGIEVPDESALDDEALHAKLWQIIREMAELGLYLESTDHLSDRELYRFSPTDALWRTATEALPIMQLRHMAFLMMPCTA